MATSVAPKSVQASKAPRRRRVWDKIRDVLELTFGIPTEFSPRSLRDIRPSDISSYDRYLEVEAMRGRRRIQQIHDKFDKMREEASEPSNDAGRRA